MIDMSTKKQGVAGENDKEKVTEQKGTVNPLPPLLRVLKAQKRASFPYRKYRIAVAERR